MGASNCGSLYQVYTESFGQNEKEGEYVEFFILILRKLEQRITNEDRGVFCIRRTPITQITNHTSILIMLTVGASNRRIGLVGYCILIGWFCIEAAVAFQVGHSVTQQRNKRPSQPHHGWVEQNGGEWVWKEDDPNYVPPPPVITATATPQLPSGVYRPKQSLGQNYLKDPNTVSKIIRAFHDDATAYTPELKQIIELGPGAGALTDTLVKTYGVDPLHVIEIDERSIELLRKKHPRLSIQHDDVLQVDYTSLQEEHPLVVVGNLPYYITSQILFCLADASHQGAVGTATVTMQWEVAQRLVAVPSTKDYGILSVVFQLYADTRLHFKIPPTVFYPQPKVDSALVGLRFADPETLAERLDGVHPEDLRRVVTKAFQQRRKILRKSLKSLLGRVEHEYDSSNNTDGLPESWETMRPEELTPAQFVALTKHILGTRDGAPWGERVWRKAKHGRESSVAP